jgi:hypothetical protein
VGKSHPPECQYRISTCQWPEERESVPLSDANDCQPTLPIGTSGTWCIGRDFFLALLRHAAPHDECRFLGVKRIHASRLSHWAASPTGESCLAFQKLDVCCMNSRLSFSRAVSQRSMMTLQSQNEASMRATKFYTLHQLKIAKALGISAPVSSLAVTDEVIE